MKITSPTTTFTIPDEYGCNAAPSQITHGINPYSFPFGVIDIPAGTKYLAVTLQDFDTIKLFGFTYIHWVLTDVPVTGDTVDFPADFSQTTLAPQGFSSNHSAMKQRTDPEWDTYDNHVNLETHYTGPRPRFGTHNYRMNVYALKEAMGFDQGAFDLADVMNKLDGLVVDHAAQNFPYERKIPVEK